MIRVLVNLHRGGLGPAETLAEVEISNQSLLAPVSDYRVRVVGKHGRYLPSRESRVVGHRREREPVLTLVRKALEEAGY